MDDHERVGGMKILVVSLLRLGDILMASSLIKGLQRKYRDADIHILINGQFHSVSELLPNVKKVHCFHRNTLQEIIGSKERNLLEAYYQVEDLVDALKDEKFDKVFNITHNRLSGWLTTLIGCPDTQGVSFSKEGRFVFGSPWFRYLNNLETSSESNIFHSIDVFHYGAGLEDQHRGVELVQSSSGRSFAQSHFQGIKNTPKIVIQPTSFESKKTFEVEKWKNIIKTIRRSMGDVDISVMGAPFEKNIVDQICEKSGARPCICDLSEGFSVLNQADLLLTVDTSVKHLASATNIKVVEVSLGSSDYRKTGVFTSGAIIIQGNVPCAPCPHSTECSQPSHHCGEKISPQLVGMVVRSLLHSDHQALRVLAHEYQEEAVLLETHITALGDWVAYSLAENFSVDHLSGWLERFSHKLLLQNVKNKPIGEYGSEGCEIKTILDRIYPEEPKEKVRKGLDSLEAETEVLSVRIKRMFTDLKSILGVTHDRVALRGFIRSFEALLVDLEKSTYFRSYVRDFSREDLSKVSPFVAIKRIKDCLTTLNQRASIEEKLIRGLKTEYMELI